VLRRPVESTNYTSIRFGQTAALHGVTLSMGSVGDSFDNALMENFWSTLKIERVYRDNYATRSQADNALFDYIDGFYNPRRIQRRLGYRSPDQYEAAWHADASRVSAGAGPPAPSPPGPGSAEVSGVKGGPQGRRRRRSKTLEAGAAGP
jgi:putative transposase